MTMSSSQWVKNCPEAQLTQVTNIFDKLNKLEKLISATEPNFHLWVLYISPFNWGLPFMKIHQVSQAKEPL